MAPDDTRLKTCPRSPNCVCSDAQTKTHQIAPLKTPDLDAAWSALLQHLMERSEMTVMDEQPDYIRAEARTALLRFVDDVEFEKRPPDAIAVRSASRVGYSDLGANRKRVERIRATLVAQGVVSP